jgi:hypothetical protein
LDAAASNAVASCRSGGFQIAGSVEALIDVWIYIDKDWSIFKTQAKQRLGWLGMLFFSWIHFRLCLSLFVDEGF